MSVPALTVYILIWPVIVTVILAVICGAFYQEWRAAKKEGKDII